jgi:soluble lytic murein transglycosylase-like protein
MCGRAKGKIAALPRALGVALLIVLVAPTARADIWRFVDSKGIVHLSDRSMGPGSVLLVRGNKRVKGATVRDHKKQVRYSERNEQRYTELLNRAARELRLDRALVHAVVRVESAFDPQAVSRAGAIGLMQLMPDTAKRYGVNDLRNPSQNVYAGVRHLRDLIHRFNDVVLALAAYNAGENAVLRYGRTVPPYPETQDYVRKVLNFYRLYRATS